MKSKYFILFLVLTFFLAACQPNSTALPEITISVSHDGNVDLVTVAENSTVRQAISALNLTLASLDRVEPGLDTQLSVGMSIKVIRVKEEFVVEESPLSFESQTIKNESLTAGQTILIQAGVNGIQSITYRVLTEDGKEVSRTVTKTEITQPATPEIIMLGVQSQFKAVEIPGLLAYISSANAWLMDTNTGNRRSIISTGDLDGRIFSISPDRNWLLFSRSSDSKKKDLINSLWVINLSESNTEPLSLNVNNVVHFADWVPGKTQTIAFSTVEPRSTSPGWQANNDLQVLQFDSAGKTINLKKIVDSNSGGIYGWWGTIYSWSPDASEIAYARPDGIGLVDSKTGHLTPLIEFTPYQTQGDWAWVPGISWANNHASVFTVLPVAQTSSSTQFDLAAITMNESQVIYLQEKVGLFSYPVVSETDSQGRNQVAYLSAILPDQSETSRYDLYVMDRDGSNAKKLYPGEGIQGLEPQSVLWSPTNKDNDQLSIAFIAQGNLFFCDPSSGVINQITGDGSISRIDWK